LELLEGRSEMMGLDFGEAVVGAAVVVVGGVLFVELGVGVGVGEGVGVAELDETA
jgi:hypothetical protein